MRFMRLFSATAVVAAVSLLASCGESSNPTSASAATDPSFAVGPRVFTLTPVSPGWTKLPADPIPTDTRQVLIGGLLAAATYPTFGAPVYTGTSPAGNWLDMNLSPNFSLNPLGWKVTFKLKQSAQALPIGNYTATIPVMVPAALNNPQNIVVTFSNCGNCLFLGDSRLTTISSGGPTYDWYDLNYYNTGSRSFYVEYRVFLRPGETMYIQNWGGCYSPIGGDICDPALTLYDSDAPTFTGITYNDDCNGLNSQIGPITNNGATSHEYRVRAATYGTQVTGTETVYISPTPYCGGGGPGLRQQALPDSVQAIIDAKAKLPGGH
jgi:hypothetical protein